MATIINADTSDGLKLTSDTSGQLELQSAGSTKATIDTSGNVGIGNNSPANKLEVSGAIVAQGAATAYTNTGLYLQNKGSSVFDVGAWRSGASVAELSFSTDSGSDASPVEQMRLDNAGNLKFNSGFGSVGTAYGVRAWVNFDGTGTVAIRDSGNVSSITDNGTGNYTVNFATNMPDDDYSVSGTTGIIGNNNVFIAGATDAPTVSAYRFNARASSNVNLDVAILNVNFVR
jgi:hypothetical protein